MCSLPLILSKLAGSSEALEISSSCGEQDCGEMKVNVGCGGKNMDYSETFFSFVLPLYTWCPTLHMGDSIVE